MATTSSLLKQQEAVDQLSEESSSKFLPVLHKHKGFWYPGGELFEGVLQLQSQFEARCDDVILASSVKTGTTWLKALSYNILAGCRSGKDEDHEDQLQVKNPHEQVRTLECVYAYNLHPDPSHKPSPRLLHTHLPYSALSDSIKNSVCKIVYIARNPKDVLVSMWPFFQKVYNNEEPYTLEKAYDAFSKGVHPFGPYHDHVLEYWLESLKTPQKILFLKYEDLKRDPKGQVQRLAQFLGRTFTSEEEVDAVVWKSSFERLKNLEVNKNGLLCFRKRSVTNSSFFRRGDVGDWKNYLTTEMEQALDQITRAKLEDSHLHFET